ncbi:MAG: MBL fold metallo-hydrolase [Anaerolineae bacterium]|jgi:phosphoribosyl 1,2-cyclic phosphate phosphodiesterase
MKVTFLGTSAANANPEAFCQCPNCTRARELGGPSLRKRSAVLVNDDLLIDLGPDVQTAAQMYKRSLTAVRYCLQTHAHSDHLDASHLLSRSPEWGVMGAPRLHFYASRGTLQAAAQVLERDLAPAGLLALETGEFLNLELHAVEAMQTFAAGAYRVTAFAANHDPMVEPLLYAIQQGKSSVLYGTDTAALPEEFWQELHLRRFRFDLAIWDHTYGPDEEERDHLSAREVTAYAARMREEGLLADRGRVLATHIAHEGNPAHPELAAFALRHGYEVAYDGLVVCLGEASSGGG